MWELDPGRRPSPFTIFYSVMVEYSEVSGSSRWQQPPDVTCVERDAGTNHLRHHLAEILVEQSHQELGSWLAMCNALTKFQEVLPTQERRKKLQTLRNEVDEYYDEENGEWISEIRFSLDEANDMAQSLHRYRLFAFSNFLTTPGTVSRFESSLVDILCDARPGSVVLVLGGKGGAYHKVYKSLDQLAVPAGFQLKVEGELVSSSDRKEIDDRVYEEGQRFYEHLKSFIPLKERYAEDADKDVNIRREVRADFEGSCCSAPSSQVRIYRK